MRASVASPFRDLEHEVSLVWPLSSSRLCRQPRLTLWFKYTHLFPSISSSGSSLPHVHTFTCTRANTHTHTHANAGSVRWKSSWRGKGGGGGGCRWEKQRGILRGRPPRRPRLLLRVALPASLTVWPPWSWCEAWPVGREAGSSWTPSCPELTWAEKKKKRESAGQSLVPPDVCLFCFEDKLSLKLHLVPIAKRATGTLFPW